MLVDGVTNEITAALKLLRQIDVKGAIVNLDAMSFQKKIAQEIHFVGAHYLLALLRKLTLNLLQQDQTIKDTMRGRRIRAALCEKTPETFLKFIISKHVKPVRARNCLLTMKARI